MTDIHRIVRVSRWFAWVCLGLLILLPLYLAHHWLLPVDQWLDGMPIGGRGLDVANWPPGPGKRVLGIAITFVPGCFVGLALLRLRRLFLNYTRCEFFTDENVRLYSGIAGAALGFVLCWILAESALSVMLSYDTALPQVSVSFTHTHATALFAALMFRLVTWIMAVGHALELENQGFV